VTALGLGRLQAARREGYPVGATILRNVALLAIAVAFFVPLIWMIAASLDSNASFSLAWPNWSLANYRYALGGGRAARPLWNSFMLAAGSALISTTVGLLAAYALARFDLRFKRPLLLTVLFATGLPIEVLMIPAFSLFVRENLVDSMPATIVFLSTTSLPFSIWLLKNFIDQIPIEIEEAAQIDGAGPLERIRRHVLPLAAAGIAVSALFSFMNAWGQFIIPFVLLQSPSHAPASVAIYQFLTAFGRVQYGPLAAFGLVFSLPVVALYLALGRYFGGGFSFGGGVKG
jgi:multiple sugar transport system permease protein